MGRLDSRQKTYVNTKRFTLKSILTISLFIALFTIPELKAQNLITSKTSSANASHEELISYTIQYATTGLVATTNEDITDFHPNPYEILPLATYFYILNSEIGERTIEGNLFITRIK